MSWFLGIVWKSPQLREEWGHLLPQTDHNVVNRPNLSIYAGGPKATTFYKEHEGDVFAGVGTPISGLAEGSVDFGWSDNNANRIINDHWMDGHFAFAHQSADQTTTLRVDHFGLRSVFACKHEAGIVFSTSLSRIAVWLSSPKINGQAFSTHWLGHNQLSRDCLLQDVVRLSPGNRMVIRDTVIQIQPVQSNPPDICTIDQLLETILRAPSQISLGLSGGLDSRFLLSQLIRSRGRFALHVWGHDKNADVEIATRLAHSISQPVSRPDAHHSHDQQIQCMSSFGKKMDCSAPATSSLEMDNFRVIAENGFAVIDGAFGEIFRRQYYNRLVLASMATRYSKPDKIVTQVSHSLRFHRADIFSTDFSNVLEDGFKSTVEGICADIQNADNSLPEFADNLAISYRLSNFFGYGQSWMDETGVSIMPLAQPSLVRCLLQSTTGRQRKGGKLVRRMIRRDAPILARLPLVKGSGKYPFSLGPGVAHLWTRCINRSRTTDLLDTRSSTLIGLREWVLDITESRSVRESEYLDTEKVSYITRAFYSGDYSAAPQLDWLLSFVLWIREIETQRL